MGQCCGRCCAAEPECDCCGWRRRAMGYSGAALLASATVPAGEDESGRRTLALPLHECLPWKLANSKCICVRGYIPEKPYRWSVNLMNGGLDGDIALHINPRHDLGHVVRNSRLSGAWGREELCATPPLPFAPGQDFELVIFCTESCYLMSVNGRHLASFATRSALSAVRTLHVDGTVQLTGIEYSDGVKQYPPLPAPALALADRPGGGYHADKPLFPCRLPEPMQEGGVIQLTGRVRLLPFSFFVNLLHGSQLFPEPDILLHFNPRFQVLDCFEVIVANSRVAGWGKEQIVQDFPFRAGRHFVIRIVCQPGSWDVFVDGRLLLKFPHRLSKSLLDAVEVRGDVIVESVHFEPNSKDLIQF